EAAFPDESAEPETPAAAPEAAERPYADLSARELVVAAARARQGLDRAQRGLHNTRVAWDYFERATVRYGVDRAKAEDGHGPAVTKLEEQRAVLRDAAVLVDAIEHAAQRHQSLQEGIDEDYRTGFAASTRAKENPIKLRLQGTSRPEQTGIADAAYARIETARREQAEARREAERAQRSFRGIQAASRARATSSCRSTRCARPWRTWRATGRPAATRPRPPTLRPSTPLAAPRPPSRPPRPAW
ncbi:hypothetical protein ADL26_20530, partial [Thermoactinomyces vulgaris]